MERNKKRIGFEEQIKIHRRTERCKKEIRNISVNDRTELRYKDALGNKCLRSRSNGDGQARDLSGVLRFRALDIHKIHANCVFSRVVTKFRRKILSPYPPFAQDLVNFHQPTRRQIGLMWFRWLVGDLSPRRPVFNTRPSHVGVLAAKWH
jgi:hypothetical protein